MDSSRILENKNVQVSCNQTEVDEEIGRHAAGVHQSRSHEADRIMRRSDGELPQVDGKQDCLDEQANPAHGGDRFVD